MHMDVRRSVASTLLVVLGSSSLATLPAGATATTPASVQPGVEVRAAQPDVELPAPARGARAVELLGDQLDESAHLNDTTAPELEELLLEDRTAWIDRTGRLYFVEPTVTDEVAESAPVTSASAAPHPLSETFTLNSKPLANRTIYLDFDGADVTGTQWNAGGVPAGSHAGWSVDADPAFSDSERAAVQSVWQRVAEDFAAFDVNVTTQDPGAAALERSSSSDQVFGTRTLISDSSAAQTAICRGGCGGVAYVGVFDAYGTEHGRYQPAWVFPASLGDSAKNIAEAASHEVGHNLGLSHDGNATTGYYGGHGHWAPIMGVGYGKALSQWSRGSYTGANNTEDDIAVMRAHGATLRADEAGATAATAAATLPAGPAYVSTATDRDVYRLGRCTGTVTLAADNAPNSPNLDLELALLDVEGNRVAVDAPTSGAVNGDVTTGTDAALSRTLASGTYFVEVDGGGNGGFAANQYDDYGSLGAYTLRQTGCTTVAASAPSAPQSVTATASRSAAAVTLTWAHPADDGGSAVTGYTVTRSDGGAPVTLGASARRLEVTGLALAREYTFTVRATNASGSGLGAAATVTTWDGGPAVVPSAPQDVRADVRALNGTATVSWAAPATDGGSAVTGYLVDVAGTQQRVAPGQVAEVSGLTRGQTYPVSVVALNAVGSSPAATTSLTPAGAPTAPATVDLGVSGTSGTLSWTAPHGYDLGLVTGWRVVPVHGGVAAPAQDLPAGQRSLALSNLPVGSVRYDVSALSGTLVGAVTSSATVTVAAPPPPPPTTQPPGSPKIGKPGSGKRGGEATVTVRWSPPAADGGAPVVGYQIQVFRVGSSGKVRPLRAARAARTGSRSATLTLSPGSYQFAVRAHNAAGQGPASSRSVTVEAR